MVLTEAGRQHIMAAAIIAFLTGCGGGTHSAPAGLVLSWAVERFGTKLAMASSFQDAVLLEMTSKVAPDYRRYGNI